MKIDIEPGIGDNGTGDGHNIVDITGNGSGHGAGYGFGNGNGISGGLSPSDCDADGNGGGCGFLNMSPASFVFCLDINSLEAQVFHAAVIPRVRFVKKDTCDGA